MNDSKRYGSTGTENMREKITKNYSWRDAMSKIFRDGGANSVLALLISLKWANSLLWVKFWTQNTILCIFARILLVCMKK